MEIAGINPIEILHAACVAAAEDSMDEIMIDLSEKSQTGLEMRIIIRIRRERES